MTNDTDVYPIRQSMARGTIRRACRKIAPDARHIGHPRGATTLDAEESTLPGFPCTSLARAHFGVIGYAMRIPQAPRLLAVGWIFAAAGLLACAPAMLAAAKPLADLTAEERALRALVQPLREGLSEGPELQPLREWLDAREAAGRGRDSERELRRVLKRITEDFQADVLRAAQWVRTLQLQRSNLYGDLSEGNIGLARAVEKSQELAPLPTEEELLPGRFEMSDQFVGGDVGASPATFSAPTQDSVMLPVTDEALPHTTDLDAPALLNRLTMDLTILGHLQHQCDNDYEQEKRRHREALQALEKFLQVRRNASTAADSGS